MIQLFHLRQAVIPSGEFTGNDRSKKTFPDPNRLFDFIRTAPIKQTGCIFRSVSPSNLIRYPAMQGKVMFSNPTTDIQPVPSEKKKRSYPVKDNFPSIRTY